MKISEAFDRYIDGYMVTKNLGQRIREQYVCTKRYVIECMGDKDISEVTLDDISGWMTWLRHGGRSNNTAIGYLCRLRMILKYTGILGYDCLPWALVPVPRRDPVTPSYLTPEEVKLMIDSACNIRAKFVVSLFYGSGLRLSELISLNRGQIVDRHFTVIGKGKKERLCFIDKRTEQLMEEYLKTRHDKGDALVATHRGTRMTPTNVQLIIHNAAEAAGITYKHVHPHALRHSFATDYIRNNGNIRDLALLMGHTNINTTAHYTHIENKELREKYDIYHKI